MKHMRVVSLVPSATETLTKIGITPIGVTRFCERTDLVSMGGTKDPHTEQIIAAKPDLVVMCDQENRREDYEALTEAGLSVFAFSLTDIAHVATQVSALAARLGVPENNDAQVIRVQTGLPIRVWVPIWKRPWMTIGGDTYASTLLAAAGFCNVYTETQTRYPESALEEVSSLRPDFVLAPNEPYPFAERHRQQLEVVAPVCFVDGKDLFWWGTRTPRAHERLQDLRSQLLNQP